MKKLLSLFSIILALIIYSVSESSASISFVQGESLYPGNSLAFTNNVTAGNLIIVVAQYATFDPSATVSDNQGNSYTLITKSTPSTANTYLYMWYAKNVIGGSTTVTTTSGIDTGISILEFRGVDTTAPIDVYGYRSSSLSTNHPTIDLTTTHDGDLIVAVFGNELNVGAATPDSGWTETTEETNHWHETMYKITTIAGIYTAGTTQNAAVQAGIAAAFTVAGTQGSGGGSGGGDVANTYYVDVNSIGGTCSDSNPGTSITAPWCSLERATDWQGAANSGVVAGDTVYVRRGTYYVTRPRADDLRYKPALNPSNSGTSGNPVTFKNYNGESVTITYSPSETHHGPILGAFNRDHIVWDGFIIQEVAANNTSDTGPVVVWESNNVTIQNSTLSCVVIQVNDNHNCLRIELSNNTSIKNNKIHGIGNGGWGHNHAAIMTYATNDLLLEHNEIYDNYTAIFIKGGSASGIWGNRRPIMRLNLIHDNNVGIRMSFTSDAKIFQNILYSNSTGIEFAESCLNLSCSGQNEGFTGPANNDVYNNTIYDSVQGITFLALPDRQLAGGNDWRNNIVVLTTRNPSYIFNTDNSTNGGNYLTYTHFASDYNIIYQSWGSNFRFAGINNTFAQWRSNTGYEGHSINSDPLLLSPVNHNFHLLIGSPAINAGTDFGDLDGDGNTAEAINMGAYITGIEIIGIDGIIDSTPPRTPSTLQVR